MGDMIEDFRFMKEINKRRKAENLANADPTGWKQLSPYHWQRTLHGDPVDYWPSRNKWRWRNRTRVGEIKGWLARKESQPG